MRKQSNKIGIQRILVPTDFSAPSGQALEYAAMIAKQFKADLILLHVIDSLSYSVTDTLNVIEHRRALETLARSLLRNLSQPLLARHLAVTTQLTSGTPHHEILQEAQTSKVDLIVMGTHGRTGVRHLLLGSVAEKVVRLSACPVVTVPLSLTE